MLFFDLHDFDECWGLLAKNVVPIMFVLFDDFPLLFKMLDVFFMNCCFHDL